MKMKQLSVKDKQIEELNARLAESSAALVAAQQTAQAHRLSMQGRSSSSLSGKSDELLNDQDLKEKKNWFHRIFSKW